MRHVDDDITLLQHGVELQHSRLLDLGCGTGLVGEALRTGGYEGQIDGVDISETSLELALAKVSSKVTPLVLSFLFMEKEIDVVCLL